MNNTIEEIKLPFWETIRRSFLYVAVNKETYLKVSAVWFAILIYEMFTGFPSICNLDNRGCTGGWMQNVSMILMSVASVAVVIAYCRFIILKETSKYFSFAFGKREVKYLLFGFFIVASITIPSIIIIFAVASLGQLVHLPENFFSILILVPFLITIYFSRLYLVFPAIAVDNKEINLKTSYKMTAGNANKIFWGQMLMMAPIILLLFLMSFVFKLVGSDNYIIKFVFVALVLALTFLDSCLKAAFYSHLYQFFTFHYKAEYSKVSE